MNDRTIVQHPNGYSGVLMGKSTMMIYDKDDNCILHTCFRTPNTEKELYEVLETMPRFIEILASVEADRKTEPTSSKMEQVEDDAYFLELMGAVERGEISDAEANQAWYEYINHKDEPQTQMKTQNLNLTFKKTDEPQTDCGDFANRLAYERGVKHAWEVAQKVFNSTVTFYEAEDMAKQIDKDINVRSKERSE